MKKISNYIFLFFLVVLQAFQLSAREFFVAPTGKNTNSGSFKKPFRTIQYALDHLKPGDICLIRKGTYRENIRLKNSGLKNKRIVIRNYKNEKVCIKPFKGNLNWKRYRGHIFKTKINDSVIQLFSNDRSLMQASYPTIREGIMNTEKWLSVEAKPSKEIILSSGSRTPDLRGAYLIALCSRALVAVNGTVISQKNAVVEIKSEAFYWEERFVSNYLGKGKGFFVGKLSFLDAPGEWFCDGGYLYYWPKNEHPQKDGLAFRTVKNTFCIDHQSYITVRGLTIIGGAISTPNSSHCIIKNVKILYPTSFFKFKSGFERVTENSKGDSDYFEGKGVELSGKNNVFSKCSITKSWGDGITIAGEQNVMKNCRVSDCNWMGMDCATVRISGIKNEVIHCDLSKSGRDVILHSGLKSGRICYNEIYNGGILCDDLGLTYCYDSDGEGTEIAYNWLHDNHAPVYGAGIYLDNMHHNFKVHHNVVWNCFIGMTINQPCSNDLIYNNTFWHNKYTMSTFHPIAGKREMTDVIYFNNITDSELKSLFHSPMEGSVLQGNKVLDNIYDVLENPRNRKFTPIPKSVIIGRGTTFEEGKFTRKKVDLGAYSIDSKDWKAGIEKKSVEGNWKMYKGILLFVVYLSLILYLIKRFRLFPMISNKTTYLLLGLKIAFGFIIFLVYTYYYPNRENAEIFKHFDDAGFVFDQLFGLQKLNYLKFITGIYEPKEMIVQLSNWNELNPSYFENNALLIRFHSLINIFSGSFYPVHVLVFAFLSFLGSYRIFTFFNYFFPEQKRSILLCVFCVPSVIFWTSGTLEDTLLLLFTGTVLYRALRIFQRKAVVFNLCVLFVALVFLYLFKPYLVIGMMPVVLFIPVYYVFKKYSMVTAFISFLGVLLTVLFEPSGTILKSIVLIQQDLIHVANEMHAHSQIAIYQLDVTPLSFIQAIPGCFWNVFLEPFPNHPLTIFQWLQCIENGFLLLLIGYAVIGKNTFTIQQNWILIFILSFTIILTLFIGWSIPIAGLISRYKVLFLPLLVTICVLRIKLKSECKI